MPAEAKEGQRIIIPIRDLLGGGAPGMPPAPPEYEYELVPAVPGYLGPTEEPVAGAELADVSDFYRYLRERLNQLGAQGYGIALTIGGGAADVPETIILARMKPQPAPAAGPGPALVG